MKSIKKSLLTCMVVGCTLSLVATGSFSAEWKVPDQWKFLKFAGGDAAGSFTPLSAKICEMINQKIPGANASSTLGGSYGNLPAVDKNKMQIALTQTTAVAEYYHGLRGLKGKETKDIRWLAAMHYGAIHMFVPKNSPIKDISEIGKKPLRTVVGPANSFTYMFNDYLLSLYGSSIKDLVARGGTASNVYYGQGVDMLKNGQIDYMAFHTGLYASMVMDAATSPGIRFLEVSPEEKAKVMKELVGMVEVVIPKDMYPGMDKDYQTFGTYFPIIISKDMPEELAYRITKVIWDNLKEIQSISAFAKDIKLENAFKGLTIPVHPGAERYYKEKGVTIPPLPKF